MNRFFSNKIIVAGIMLATFVFTGAASAEQGRLRGIIREKLEQQYGNGTPDPTVQTEMRRQLQEEESSSGGACSGVPPITSGYGANGPHHVKMIEFQAKGYNESILAFLPDDIPGKRPAVFYTHGYGPNYWKVNEELINHVVSRGYIFIFAPYPMRGEMDARYDTVWNGFETAVNKLQGRVDLTRVGFIGHSFGGGANPEMAYRAFVENGWGSRGGFMMELAPWYSYEMPDKKLQNFPSHIIHLGQVYDNDVLNDHRMAIDIYNSLSLKNNYFVMVHSYKTADCTLSAGHGMPGTKSPTLLKQYALFQSLDVLMDAAFENVPLDFNRITPTGKTYQPLEFIRDPQPIQPESFYSFKWGSPKNPRAKSAPAQQEHQRPQQWRLLNR